MSTLSETMNLLDLQEIQYPILFNDDQQLRKKLFHEHVNQILHSKNSFVIENFGKDMNWINTRRSLSIRSDFANRLTIIDFFTYCCINCIHILPDLKKVEKMFPVSKGIAVIGVHSPKFLNEKSLNNVKDAILRNDITHPVVNDEENRLWNKFDITCWPTVLIVGPEGHVIFSLVGEPQVKNLAFLCSEMLKYFDKINFNLEKTYLPIQLLKDAIKTNIGRNRHLLYPSNICCDTDETMLAISDTGNNRLLILSINGQITDIIGNGVQDYKNGTFCNSSFDSPHGLAWRDPCFIYVADTGNHCIRLVDLWQRTVATVISPLGNEMTKDVTKKDIMTKLGNFLSPWDLCFGPNTASGNISPEELNSLYIAVAGSHQIWVYYLEDFPDRFCKPGINILCEKNSYSVFAGNGKEESRNNTYKLMAGFSQPSGISFSEESNTNLYVADSESSSIRSVSLLNGSVKTVVGGGLDPTDLFQFGDQDGKGKNVRLQHPMGICVFDQSRIFVADTYNHKIKVIDLMNCTSKTFAGKGVCGDSVSDDLLQVEFNEPSGLCISQDKSKLFVADTNNHCIKIIDLKTETASLLEIQNIEEKLDPVSIVCKINLKDKTVEDSDDTIIKVGLGGEVKCHCSIESDYDIELTEGAPQPWKISINGRRMSICCQSGTIFDQNNESLLIFKDDIEDAYPEFCQANIALKMTLSFCDKNQMTCFTRKIRFNFAVEISDIGENTVDVNLLCNVK